MKRAAVLSSLFLATLTATIALAQYSGDGFEITNSTIDNGGGVSANGEFTLTGTIGQPDANHQISSGGGFLLAGGFWAKAHTVIFKNGFESN